jgi:hypothetical protein
MTKPRLFTAVLFIAISISMAAPLAPAIAEPETATESESENESENETESAIEAPSITASLNPSLSVVGTDDQRAFVEDVQSRFTSLGLALPDLEIRFSDDDEACDGHLGMFRPRSEGWGIDICSDLANVLPHELGHAWERVALSDADRQAYMAHREFETWQHTERNESAIEDVAHVVQLVVMGGGESGRADIDGTFGLLMTLSAS